MPSISWIYVYYSLFWHFLFLVSFYDLAASRRRPRKKGRVQSCVCLEIETLAVLGWDVHALEEPLHLRTSPASWSHSRVPRLKTHSISLRSINLFGSIFRGQRMRQTSRGFFLNNFVKLRGHRGQTTKIGWWCFLISVSPATTANIYFAAAF